jgi:hypothetical protein
MAKFSLPPVARPMTGFTPGNYQSYDTLSQTGKNSAIVYNEEELRAAITKVKNEIEGPFTIFLGDNIFLTQPVVLTQGCEGLIITSLGYQRIYLKGVNIPVPGEDFSISLAFLIACEDITLRSLSISFEGIASDSAAYAIVLSGVSAATSLDDILSSSTGDLTNIRAETLEIIAAANQSVRGFFSAGSVVATNSLFAGNRFSGSPTAGESLVFGIRSRQCVFQNNVSFFTTPNVGFLNSTTGSSNIIAGNMTNGSLTVGTNYNSITNNIIEGGVIISGENNSIAGNIFADGPPTVAGGNAYGLNVEG